MQIKERKTQYGSGHSISPFRDRDCVIGEGNHHWRFTIAFYGMIIAFGMVMGYLMTAFQAKRTGQEPDLYLDLALWDIVFAVIGCKNLFNVIFTWDYYKDNLLQIFNTRGGGLAIYGGVIAGVITTIIFGKVRKQNFFQLLDTACIGLITGQIIGRWGNFCNREAFGGYTRLICNAAQCRAMWQPPI